MRNRRLGWVLLLVAAVAALAGCGTAQAAGSGPLPTPVGTSMDAAAGDPTVADPGAGAPPVTGANPTGAPAQVVPAPVPAPIPAPMKPFAVGTRQLNLNRGQERPLRTVVWYPAKGTPGGGVRSNAIAASGRFPLVVFSHGLTSSPEAMQGVTTKLGAAGFVVAAPAYPFTSNSAAKFNVGDIGNQPADASTVITEVLKLNTRAGDALAGHLDPARVGAGGHSAGGYTTAGMLSGSTRDGRVKAGIIISGGSMGGQFSGPATPILFIHGDSDAVVKYATCHAVYDKLSWPKAFVTIIGGNHVSPLSNSASTRTMIDFLRWTLYGDAAAKSRLASDATVAATSRYESSP
jgi:dienelactone hydrolase